MNNILHRLLASVAFLSILQVVNSAEAATRFRANLDGSQVVPSSGSNASGLATFELNEAQTALDYFIQLEGVSLKPDITDRTEPEDVDKIHLHFGEAGANGPHVLNIFGLPSEDDDDLMIDFDAGTISGTWEDSDAINPETGELFDPTAMGTTKLLSNFVDEIFTNQLYIQVHTLEFPGSGAIRGQITGVPEPSSLFGLSFIVGLGLLSTKKVKFQ